MAKKSKDKLVKIDEVIYNAMKDHIHENPWDNPSIKHFAEKAIVRAIGFNRIDIGGIGKKYDGDIPLEAALGGTGKVFTICVICDKAFLRKPPSKVGEVDDVSRICPNCKNTIAHFAPQLTKKEGEEPKSVNKSKKLWSKK